MFHKTFFLNMQDACENIKKILAELPICTDYQIIRNITEEKFLEEETDWTNLHSVLLTYLRDMDAMQGVIFFDASEEESYWGFSFLDGEKPPYDVNEVFTEAGEGVVVVFNDEAVKDGQYPIIVVKANFHVRLGNNELDELLEETGTKDYTSRISPSIYIQIYD